MHSKHKQINQLTVSGIRKEIGQRTAILEALLTSNLPLPQ
jgi:hypothetical protein